MNTKFVLITFALSMFAAGAGAQVTPRRDTPSRLSDAKICGSDVYPDLTITSAEIKKSDDILVTVKSVGQCDAGTSLLTMWIEDVKPDSTFKGFYQKIPVPALRSGQSTQLKLWWSSGTFGSFAEGRIKLTFKADAAFKIKEEDEYNNKFELHP